MTQGEKNWPDYSANKVLIICPLSIEIQSYKQDGRWQLETDPQNLPLRIRKAACPWSSEGERIPLGHLSGFVRTQQIEPGEAFSTSSIPPGEIWGFNDTPKGID